MKSVLLVFVFIISSHCIQTSAAKGSDIRLNQVGYYPGSVKTFVVVNSKSSGFEVCDLKGKTLFNGKLTGRGTWEQSGEAVKTGDFSTFKRTGEFRIFVKDKGDSHVFEIKPHLYRDVLYGAIKSYYYHRVSFELEEKYAGKWKRPLGHPDDKVLFHPSSGKSEGHMSSPGGWYDAGDYNKYVVNAGVTVCLMQGFYELYPDVVKDNVLNIPESGNKISDLLDEIKYELDWVLTMQDKDGGVFFKVSQKNFGGFIMPHQDKDLRYVIGKATAPSLNFVAMTAQAARVFKTIDPAYSEKCLIAAQRAWEWALKNPRIIYKNPPDVHTGEYSDDKLDDEFFWAAAELLVTTGDPQYISRIEAFLDTPGAVNNVKKASWRFFMDELGVLTLVSRLEPKTPALKRLKEKAVNILLKEADSLVKQVDAIPYRITSNPYVWGSNGEVADDTVLLAHAYRLTGERRYLEAIIQTVDYLFGKNAVGYSFLTGFGDKTPMFPHQRPSGADGIEDPLPGFLVGGPNQERQDDLDKGQQYGVRYPDKHPAKCYVDLQPSYASNEVCINWNAPLVYILGFLEANHQHLQ